jgi:MFS family permease
MSGEKRGRVIVRDGAVAVPGRAVPRVTSFLTAVIAFAAVNAPTVLYSGWREQMGFPATVQTLVYAIYVAGLVPGLVLTGVWLRRVGPRALMAGAVAVSILAALALAWAKTPEVLLAARGIQGLALGVIMTASSTALYRAGPPIRRSTTALLVTLTAVLGASLGPVLAGILADASGTTAVPMAGAAIALAAPLVLLAVHRASPQSGPRFGTPSPTPTRVAGEDASFSPGPLPAPRSHLMISLTAGISWSLVGLYQSVGPGLIGAALGVDSLTALGGIVAIVLGVAGVVQIASRRVSVPRARRLGLSFLLLGIAGFAAMLSTGQVWLAVIAAAGAGIGHGFTYLSATQEMGELIRRNPTRAGPWMSRYFAIAYLCLAVFTVALGIVGDAWELAPATLVLLAVLAAGSLVMMFSRNDAGRG